MCTEIGLRRLWQGEQINLPATDGSVSIAHSGDLFNVWLDPDLLKLFPGEDQGSTKEIEVEVYEIKEKISSRDIPAFIGRRDVKDLCFTQHQIVAFCRNHRDRLSDEYATFFIFEDRKKFFVAEVDVYLNGLDVSFSNFDNEYDCFEDCSRYLVVPAI